MPLDKILEEIEATKGSAQKWYDIVYYGDQDLGVQNCPLCLLYNECMDCPIGWITGEYVCKDSPYRSWSIHQLQKHKRFGGKIECDVCRESANWELMWLQFVEGMVSYGYENEEAG